MAKITVSLVRELEKKVGLGEISYSKMVEILNQQAKLNEEAKFEFYKVKSDKIDHRGERYFKFKWNSNKVIQVCLEVNGDTKKGKGHYVGIYEISRVTLLSNWFPNYIESCSEEDFNKAFEKAIQLLQRDIF